MKWREKRIDRKMRKYSKRYLKYKRLAAINGNTKSTSLSQEKSEEKAYHERVIRSKAFHSIVGGILLLVIILILNIACGKNKAYSNIVSTISNILSSIISIIIGLGVGSYVLDFFGYVQYTKDRIKEIMLERTYINTLADKEKKKLISDIEKSLYFRDGTIPDNSLYTNIKQQIIPLLESNYILKYKIHIDCYINEDENRITKHINKTMEIVSHTDGKKYNWPFTVQLKKFDGIDNVSAYTIEKCIFNDKDVTEDIKGIIKEKEVDSLENPNDENIQMDIPYNFTLEKGTNNLEIISQSLVPLADNTFSHSVSIPCKEYEMDFDVHNDNYDVIGFGFALDTGNGAKAYHPVVVKKKFDKSYRITFDDWLLPGEGCVFVIKKVSDK